MDFIFKINDHYLYVEVKSASGDYDKEKTKRIEETFEKYQKIIKDKIVLTIVKINKDKEIKSIQNYSNISKIQPEYSTQKVIKILSKIK